MANSFSFLNTQRLLPFLVFTFVFAACDSPVHAAPGQSAPALASKWRYLLDDANDPKAVAVFAKAIATYSHLKTYSAEMSEKLVGEARNYKFTWSAPGKASLVFSRDDFAREQNESEGRFIADGKEIIRLWPGDKTYSRAPLGSAAQALNVLHVSWLMKYALPPLFTGKNMAAIAASSLLDVREENHLEDGKTMHRKVDEVFLQWDVPGSPYGQMIYVSYIFDHATHRLLSLAIKPEPGKQGSGGQLTVNSENFDKSIEESAFTFIPSDGVTQDKEYRWLPTYLVPPLVSTHPPARPSLDPKAVSLIKKAADTYSHLESLRLRVSGTGYNIFDQQEPASATLLFVRPALLRLQEESGGMTSWHLCDGKTMFWNDDVGLINQKVPLTQTPTQLADAMRFLSYPTGLYLGNWLNGRHIFQFSVYPAMLEDAIAFRVEHLPSRIVNEHKVEGVRIATQYRETGNKPHLTWEHILWINPEDGTLVRIQFQAWQGKGIKNGTIDVVEQELNARIPASAFVSTGRGKNFHMP